MTNRQSLGCRLFVGLCAGYVNYYTRGFAINKNKNYKNKSKVELEDVPQKVRVADGRATNLAVLHNCKIVKVSVYTTDTLPFLVVVSILNKASCLKISLVTDMVLTVKITKLTMRTLNSHNIFLNSKTVVYFCIAL